MNKKTVIITIVALIALAWGSVFAVRAFSRKAATVVITHTVEDTVEKLTKSAFQPTIAPGYTVTPTDPKVAPKPVKKQRKPLYKAEHPPQDQTPQYFLGIKSLPIPMPRG